MCRLNECRKRQTKLLVDVNTGFYLLDWFRIGLLMVPAVFFFIRAVNMSKEINRHASFKTQAFPRLELLNTFVKLCSC